MKQKQFLSLLLCGTLLSGLITGCEKTPEKPIVREKGTHSMDSYKEASSTPESSSSNLTKRLLVPEKYEASESNDDGSFQLTCNADIFIPDAAQVPIYKVGQRPLDDEWIAQVTKAFFGNAPVYDRNKYYQTTRAEALETLNELKAFQAEGNLDPYGLIASAKEQGLENPENYYNLQESISHWEQIYNEAPETVEKTVVTPRLNIQSSDFDNDFTGTVELGDEVYLYVIRTTLSSPMDIQISRMEPGKFALPEWISSLYDEKYEPGFYNPSSPSREKAEEMAGITPEQAIEISDQYMEKLGLQNFSAKNTSLSLCIQDSGSLASFVNHTTTYSKAGYLVSYTRDVDGFPITDESNFGGGLESINSTIEPWCYERIEFYMNQDGLQQANILNLYQIEEEHLSNAELLSFSEVTDIFEEMAPIHYADFSDSGSIKLDITDVKLGYMRIYEPSADSSHGLLVPVWDFFGSADVHRTDSFGTTDYSFGDPRRSLLTINAADGTVIDRSMGY